MDGILSQDEINALLNGMDLSDGGSSDADTKSTEIDQSILSDIEKDAIGEVANISMGTSATTLFSLVNRKVNITTPVVSLATWDTLIDDYEKPCVFIQIKYTEGLDGSNILILKEQDVKIITDLMMGGDGTNTEGELGELHLSAISEAMNQMMGSSATSLSSMLGKMIDISPPQASLINLNEFKNAEDIAGFLTDTFVRIAFRMQIGDLVDSTILQLYPIEFARSLYETFINQQMGGMAEEPVKEEVPAPAPAPVPTPEPAPMPVPEPMPMQQPDMSAYQQMPQMGMPMYQQPMMPQMGMPMYQQPMMPQMAPPVNVQPAQFQTFSAPTSQPVSQENMGLIMDVPLEVTVELGRTKKSIAEILDFAPGTIIELDKIAGEPIDVLVNGKFVAKGEVVVIEENFGIRVTEIIK
ncbi:MAG: flagellar motor switch phosphatase FliY [Lachnospiraceae bacterium]|nr:flagellar motor switch phosphatase FliY [Lachnospiraceae bacterium]